ncbi:MBL fold metallo-hydrolase [Ammoniphilus sp. 3BR4]|uniref:MBL fold metallo-hydrolase n=1 Tax=Ammoniphilus sp. 3BR4 TaxID=3158265 RepID=UPI003465FE03
MRIIREKTIFQLTFLPRFFPVNCYLVEEDDELTLIDAALPYSSKGILQAASKIGKPITRIFLTHAHEDHVGALDMLKEVLPNVPVHISSRDARLLAGDRTLDPDEPNSPIRGGVPKKLKTRADVLLHDGDRIGSLLAVDAPGHTPGSMAFLDMRNNALIAGDAFQTRGGIAVSGQLRPWFPFPAMATWNKQTALESAHKLRGYCPSLLAVGHGRMLNQPGASIDLAIREAEQNLNRTQQLRRV